MRPFMCINVGLWILVVAGCSPSDEPITPSAQPHVESVVPPLIRPKIEEAQWQRYRDAVKAQVPVDTSRLRQLLQARKSLNAIASVEDGQEQRPGTEKSLLEFETLAWEYAKSTTPEHYTRAGRAMGIEVIQALRKRQNDGRPFIDPQEPESSPYVRLVGPFARHAQEAGLLPFSESGRTSECILQAIFMKNWRESLVSRIAMEDHVLPMEYICWLRWMVERPNASNIESQLDALRILGARPNYPAQYNRGVLLLRANRHSEAVEALKASSRSEARELLNTLKP